jgi:hypothetical protein
VLDPERTPLACNRGESLMNPHFIVIGDPASSVASISREEQGALQDPA